MNAVFGSPDMAFELSSLCGGAAETVDVEQVSRDEVRASSPPSSTSGRRRKRATGRSDGGISELDISQCVGASVAGGDAGGEDGDDDGGNASTDKGFGSKARRSRYKREFMFPADYQMLLDSEVLKALKALPPPADSIQSETFSTNAARVRKNIEFIIPCKTVRQGGMRIVVNSPRIVFVNVKVQFSWSGDDRFGNKLRQVQIMDSLQHDKAVHEFNRDYLGRQPVLSPLAFNSSSVDMTLVDSASECKKSIKVFGASERSDHCSDMVFTISGTKNMGDTLGVVEYGRRLIAEISKKDHANLILRTIDLNMVNTEFDMHVTLPDGSPAHPGSPVGSKLNLDRLALIIRGDGRFEYVKYNYSMYAGIICRMHDIDKPVLYAQLSIFNSCKCILSGNDFAVIRSTYTAFVDCIDKYFSSAS